MVDELQSTVVPDTARESMTSEGGLVLTAVRHAERRFLPAVKTYGQTFLAPGSVLGVRLRAILEREARVFGRPTG